MCTRSAPHCQHTATITILNTSVSTTLSAHRYHNYTEHVHQVSTTRSAPHCQHTATITILNTCTRSAPHSQHTATITILNTCTRSAPHCQHTATITILNTCTRSAPHCQYTVVTNTTTDGPCIILTPGMSTENATKYVGKMCLEGRYGGKVWGSSVEDAATKHSYSPTLTLEYKMRFCCFCFNQKCVQFRRNGGKIQ
jgi:hypothetical protein